MKKIFIDGSAGTTGLRIYERLSQRDDISLITLSEEKRKDVNARKDALNNADIAFLCLPDAAAIEAVSLVENPDTAIIDTSTAHRCDDGWAYGFPEITGFRKKIAFSKRIANPGCHASGFIALVAPLVENLVIPRDAALSCVSLTGYSGGGKKMIAEYESTDRSALLEAPRQYGLSQSHKHLPEMAKIGGLDRLPAFMPIVAPYYSGMEVTVPLFADQIAPGVGVEGLIELYDSYYKKNASDYAAETGYIVKPVRSADESGFLSASAYSGRDDMEISVFGNNERILLVARFDNLGKGASGAAVQNMNILLGVDETTGLVVK